MTNSFIRVQVVAESKEERVVQTSDGSLAVSVRTKAERGMANKSVLFLLQRYFGKGRRIRMVSGHHSHHKIFSVN